MTARFLLDTNIVIFALRNRTPLLRQRLNDHFGRMAVSSITVADLSHGIERSTSAPRSKGVVTRAVISAQLRARRQPSVPKRLLGEVLHLAVAILDPEVGGRPYAQAVTETDFFALIDAARIDTTPDAPSADPEALAELLNDRPDDDVVQFGAAFRRQLVRLNRWSVWDAGYAASGGMSDDAFHYFRAWLVGKGAVVVDLALTDPDALVPYLDTDELENELLEYVADELLEERGADVERAAEADLTDAEPEGEPFDEETSEERHPNLAAWWAEVSEGTRLRDLDEEWNEPLDD